MDSIRIIGLGAMNLDELYRVQSVLADNETTIGEHESFPGGSAANTIYGLAKLGINTGFIGAVGADKEGKLLIQDLRKAGVDTRQIKVKEQAETGKVLGLTDYYGKRALYVAPGANSLLTREDISLEYIGQAEFIFLSSFVDDQQFEAQKWVVSNLPTSVKISFTPGAIYTRKGLNALIPILEKTDILFANESEIEELAGAEFRIAARYLINKGCQTVIVTLGRRTLQEMNKGQLTMFDFDRQPQVLSANAISDYTVNNDRAEKFRFASYVADASNEYVIESKAGYKKDTTGAGDAFAAGFLYGLLNGKGFEECSCLGGLVAQFSITKMGARQGLPTLDELARRYQQIYNKSL
jgi:ribokinase